MYQPCVGEMAEEDTRPSIIDYAEEDVELDSLEHEVAAQEPHFLDYDAVPPPDFEEHFDRCLNFGQHRGEQIKMAKKYERDGEVSDYELAASGYTKKEFTQDDNTLHFTNIAGTNSVDLNSSTVGAAKPKNSKHFLDENPIPPDYLLAQELREHRSLDRNFERQSEQEKQKQQIVAHASPSASLNERHSSLYSKYSAGLAEPIYPNKRLPRGTAWTDCGGLDTYSMPSASGELDTALGSKVECVYSLLSMLGSKDPLEMAKKFFELSENAETCTTLRRSGCIPLLVQMMHSADNEENVRKFASMALHNVVHRHTDEKAVRREAKVLRLLDQIMDYCSFLKSLLQSGGEAIADDSDRHPLAAISSLMKVSFDEEHRHAMCELGALQAIPNLVHLDHAVHGPKPEDQCCNSLRRYALMALTNLTFGDENNKALLCSQKLFMEALIAQLDAAPDDLLQVTASVLRNLSWRADSNMKAVLNEIGTVTALARAAMTNKNENTLKAILSALWNLSAHCSTNKAEFCAVDGALAFLVKMLTYEGPSKTLKIIENAGGILRNVSSHIAVCETYRQILREHNCLFILLQQLKSESLTVVSNSCGTLWNLSARCPEDQKFLWDNGAIPMLRSLIHSKHAMISEGSSSALKNLLNFRPAVQNPNRMDPIARSLGLKKLPTLNARKQKALQQELGEKAHAETSDNIEEIQASSNKEQQASSRIRNVVDLNEQNQSVEGNQSQTISDSPHISHSATLAKSESRDSIFSCKSDSEYENIKRTHYSNNSQRNANKKAADPIISRVALELQHEVETTEERPIDYSVKYKENTTIVLHDDNANGNDTQPNANYPTYQETDLDQPTDFSLRYAENQIESDVDVPVGEMGAAALVSRQHNPDKLNMKSVKPNQVKTDDDGNEILLILEDSVKCYQTEDTPYIISNAASVTDLRQGVKSEVPSSVSVHKQGIPVDENAKKTHKLPQFGSYTPEKPINYCEEGTPGYFSRYDSLSSLDEILPADKLKLEEASSTSTKQEDDDKIKANTVENELIKPVVALHSEVGTINSALETPLMFSRRSSMDSLVNEDVGPCDDKSSVVSDFSRLASGIISPSEIPDSPTQSMPQTPRRNSVGAAAAPNQPNIVSQHRNHSAIIQTRAAVSMEGKRPLNSVFEDDTSTFNVENTPAQFSCATSLSNLSIVDEEQQSTSTSNAKLSMQRDSTAMSTKHQNTISEGEEDESNLNSDDILLASCINIGMNRVAELLSDGDLKDKALGGVQAATMGDEAKHYCTEDTPALLSKVGSNTNLSLISMDGSRNNLKDEINVYGIEMQNISNTNPYTQTQSDDVSSNASDCGGAVALSSDILEQCIRDGMKKQIIHHAKTGNSVDPIAMMRRGGTLPPYLPVNDEMNKYLIEDSPCNFSVVSDLSNLTVGSSLVGPAVRLKDNLSNFNEDTTASRNTNLEVARKTTKSRTIVVNTLPKDDVRRESHYPDDSLSSLSIDSEDDTNLLSLAIAAGCNRPKSNLGFNSSLDKKRINSKSASQPIPIVAASSTSSLTTSSTRRHNDDKQYSHQQQQQFKNHFAGAHNANNESFSSVDSSDSNDNQSKSLFELCILTGMYKTKDEEKNTKRSRFGLTTAAAGSSSTQSNPNLKQFDSLPMPLPHKRINVTEHHNSQHHRQHHHNRERELKDEKILLECINSGISKKIGASGEAINASAAGSNVGNEQFRFNALPKNAQATSAAALGLCHPVALTTLTSADSIAAPGVEENSHEICHRNSSSNRSNNSHINNATATLVASTGVPKNQQVEQTAVVAMAQPKVNVSHPEAEKQQRMMENIIGYKDNDSSDSISDEASSQSFVITTTTTNSLDIELKNAVEQKLANKQKDPDLMLKSVERLTMEFVTSAEQLRTQPPISNPRVCALLADDTVSSSNNTWNEHTCPNDVSFPSVSVTAPVLASLNTDDDDVVGGGVMKEVDEEEEQATEADFNNFHDDFSTKTTSEAYVMEKQFILAAETQPNSLETVTDTLVNEPNIPDKSFKNFDVNIVETPRANGINFELGGQVKSAALGAAGFGQHYYFNGTSGSTMTNSTIIAFEARALSDNLKQLNYDDDDNTDITFSVSSLDLDNIRPPSGMESLNISSCNNDYYLSAQPNSLQHVSMGGKLHLSTKSPKFPRKSLPANLVARRALGQLTGSAESVNSSCNLLDNIKPPSLMDELLDSMVSVASIQSEVADGENNSSSIASSFSMSNYETAAGVNTFDDNTITLASCYENMPTDCVVVDDDEEATFNDFSSAGSTPKKSPSQKCINSGKRTLTPKQKRSMAKDRYRTYTISSPVPTILNAAHELTSDDFDDDTIQVEIIELPQVDFREDELAINAQEINKNIETASISIQMHSNTKEEVDDESDIQQNSETESCHGQEGDDFESNAEADNEKNMTCIDQPSEAILEEETIKKPVRGRKKPVYVSPYSQHQNSNRMAIMRTNSKGNIFNTVTSRKVAIATNTKNIASKTQKTNGSTPTAKAPTAKFERQGTFVKDEPTNVTAQVPVVATTVSATTTKSATSSPTNQRASKLPTKRAGLPIAIASPKRSSSSTSTTRKSTIATTIAGLRQTPVAATNAANVPQRSNTNIRLSTKSRRAVGVTSRSSTVPSKIVSRTTPPSRSNSNLNSNNDALVNINQAKSRIASIWKRVGEAKASTTNVKQATSASKPTPLSTNTNLQKTRKSVVTSSAKALNIGNNNSPRPPTLIRSSTFDNTPKAKTVQQLPVPGAATGKINLPHVAVQNVNQTRK